MIRLRPGTTDDKVYQQIYRSEFYRPCIGTKWEAIIDGGANVGLSTRWFAEQCPSARIFAFEPDRGNFAQLLQNVEGLPNVIPYLGALWHRPAFMHLVDPGIGEFGYQVREDDAREEQVRGTIPAFDIEDFVGIHRPCLVKLDVEGSEEQLFDWHRWMNDVDMIAVEMHTDRAWQLLHKALELLMKNRKISHDIHTEGETTFIRLRHHHVP